MARKKHNDADAGLLLIDKPAGPSSHDLVAWVRRATGIRAVGHCGTLDPAATGLLVLCLGPATKLVEPITGGDKGYRARFALGESTDTADAAGEVVARAEATAPMLEAAAGVLEGMKGALDLPPPAYSAVRVGGRRAHAIARERGTLSLEARRMVVHEIRDLRRQGRRLEAEIRVSKGTYIRSLAVELGRRLGIPAHLAALRRVSSGPLSVDHPDCLSGFTCTPRSSSQGGKPRWTIALADTREGERARVLAHLLPPETGLELPGRHLRDEEVDALAGLRRLQMGQRLSPDSPEGRALDCGAGLDERFWIRTATSLTLVRLERGPRGPRLAPDRVLQWGRK
jgi:tRNA pseudouridine55 synthase